MALFNLKIDIPTFLLMGILALAVPSSVMSTRFYKGPGNCGTVGGPVGHVVTIEFFDAIKNQSDASCAGKNFYKIEAFLTAVSSFPDFGIGSADDLKREIAAFFAHITHETGHFCYVEEIDKSNRYCDESSKLYPCAPGKSYYGRGPMLLRWNFNYGRCGQAIGFDGLNSPETVANDPVISFKSALWYWMTYAHSVMNQGFGETIQKISALDCNCKNPESVKARIGYYTDYCKKFGVSPGEKLSC